MMVLSGADGSGSLYSWANNCTTFTNSALSNLAVMDLDFQGSIASFCFRWSVWATMVAYDFSNSLTDTVEISSTVG